MGRDCQEQYPNQTPGQSRAFPVSPVGARGAVFFFVLLFYL